jgi:hypothetical protein
MATTCYASLTFSGASQISPALFTSSVDYALVDTVADVVKVSESSGGYQGHVDVILSPPLTQQGVLAALQAAIQAAEPASPALSFIWLRL